MISSSVLSAAGSLQQAFVPVAYGLARSLAGASLPQGALRSFSGTCASREESARDDQGEAPPRFLVTGAGGQIGTELLHYLRERIGPINVVATDVRNFGGVSARGPFAYCDVTDKDSLSRLVVEHRITNVLHLASLLSAVGERNPQLALRVNMLGIQNVLEVAAQHHVSVFAPSTIAVFGDTTPKVDTPDETVCEPSTMYGLTKVHVELLGKYYADKLGVDFRSLRYPGIISSLSLPGGGTTDYTIEMYMAAVLGQRYKCYIHPDTPLPMMYMPDCLRATWELVAAPREGLSRVTYNVTAMSFTPAQLEASIRLCYPKFEVDYEPDFRQDIAASWPASIDDSRANEDWGWRPRFDLDAMTEDMLAALLRKFQASIPEPGGCVVLPTKSAKATAAS
eukprot:jgi/Ulvmu1/10910/UM007_0087.1